MPKRKVVEQVKVEESGLSSPPADLPNGVNGTKKSARKKTQKRKVKVEEEADEEAQAKRGKNRKLEVKEEETAELDGDGEVVEKISKRKRKTKEEKEAEAMPLAARTVGHKLFIGAHVSSAGGQYCTRRHLRSYRTRPKYC